MAPTSIDGNDITGATIDGQDVSEITVDGDVVFTAGPDIPDSAIHQWKMDEGSGTTMADSIGSEDATINGATWVSNADAEGGEWLLFDGDNDDAQVPNPPDATGDSGSMAFTVDVSSDETNFPKYIWSCWNVSGSRCYIRVDNSDGDIDIGLGDNGGISTTASISFNSKVRVGFSWDAGDWDVAVNGSISDSGTYGGTINISVSDWTWGRASWEPSHHIEHYSDNTIMYDKQLTDAEWGKEYSAQPWT